MGRRLTQFGLVAGLVSLVGGLAQTLSEIDHHAWSLYSGGSSRLASGFLITVLAAELLARPES